MASEQEAEVSRVPPPLDVRVWSAFFLPFEEAAVSCGGEITALLPEEGLGWF